MIDLPMWGQALISIPLGIVFTVLFLKLFKNFVDDFDKRANEWWNKNKHETLESLFKKK